MITVREACRWMGVAAFTHHAGVNDGHLGRILAGARWPCGASLAKLARALGHGSPRSGEAEAAGADHANAQAAPELPAVPIAG